MGGALTVERWNPALRAQAGAMLAESLRAGGDRVEAIAGGLAPDGPGPGARFNEYGQSLMSPTKRVAYQKRFAGLDELLALLEAGHPGAIELGLELQCRIAPEACVPVAELLLPNEPWPALGAALGQALGRCASERSFRLLMEHPNVPYLRNGLGTNGYAGGVAESWAIVRRADLASPALDPRTRVAVLPALSYLLLHDPKPALDALVALLDTAGEVNVYAAHALAQIDPSGRAALLGDLERAQPGAKLTFSQRLAVKVLLERDPRTTVDALGGEAFLLSVPGRPRLGALLDWIRWDTFSAKREPGGSRGWLAADARIAGLCTALKGDRDRELAALGRDLVATLPKEARPRTTKAKTPKKRVPALLAPEPALLAEMHAIETALARLVDHLRATNYRFAQPKRALVPPKASDLSALKRLEKKVVVPPVLAAFWRTVGSVDLRGQARDWPVTTFLGFPGAKEPVWLTDPLVIAPAAMVVAETLEESLGEPFALRLAPDATEKAGYSGGRLTLWLPQDGADPRLEPVDETLLAHLRRALAWGGFPGFATIDACPTDWIAAARAACA